MFNDQNKKHGMDMIFIDILQLNWYTVPELPPSRNTLHNCKSECNVYVYSHSYIY